MWKQHQEYYSTNSGLSSPYINRSFKCYLQALPITQWYSVIESTYIHIGKPKVLLNKLGVIKSTYIHIQRACMKATPSVLVNKLSVYSKCLNRVTHIHTRLFFRESYLVLWINVQYTGTSLPAFITLIEMKLL